MSRRKYLAARRKFRQLIESAMIVAAAGLASDTLRVTEAMRARKVIRIDIPYSTKCRPILAYGGEANGAFRDFVQVICRNTMLTAPIPSSGTTRKKP